MFRPGRVPSGAMTEDQRTEERRVIGRRLKAARKRAGLSQLEVAQAIDVTERTYGGYEQGRNDAIYRQVFAIADVLGVDPDSIVGPAPTVDESAEARLSRVELELRDLREMLTDPDKLRAAADAADRARR